MTKNRKHTKIRIKPETIHSSLQPTWQELTRSMITVSSQHGISLLLGYDFPKPCKYPSNGIQLSIHFHKQQKNGRFEKHFLPYLNKKRCFTNHPRGIFNKFKISNRTIHITNHLPHLHEQEKKSKNTNDCFLL